MNVHRKKKKLGAEKIAFPPKPDGQADGQIYYWVASLLKNKYRGHFF